MSKLRRSQLQGDEGRLRRTIMKEEDAQRYAVVEILMQRIEATNAKYNRSGRVAGQFGSPTSPLNRKSVKRRSQLEGRRNSFEEDGDQEERGHLERKPIAGMPTNRATFLSPQQKLQLETVLSSEEKKRKFILNKEKDNIAALFFEQGKSKKALQRYEEQLVRRRSQRTNNGSSSQNSSLANTPSHSNISSQSPTPGGRVSFAHSLTGNVLVADSTPTPKSTAPITVKGQNSPSPAATVSNPARNRFKALARAYAGVTLISSTPVGEGSLTSGRDKSNKESIKVAPSEDEKDSSSVIDHGTNGSQQEEDSIDKKESSIESQEFKGNLSISSQLTSGRGQETAPNVTLLSINIPQDDSKIGAPARSVGDLRVSPTSSYASRAQVDSLFPVARSQSGISATSESNASPTSFNQQQRDQTFSHRSNSNPPPALGSINLLGASGLGGSFGAGASTRSSGAESSSSSAGSVDSDEEEESVERSRHLVQQAAKRDLVGPVSKPSTTSVKSSQETVGVKEAARKKRVRLLLDQSSSEDNLSSSDENPPFSDAPGLLSSDEEQRKIIRRRPKTKAFGRDYSVSEQQAIKKRAMKLKLAEADQVQSLALDDRDAQEEEVPLANPSTNLPEELGHTEKTDKSEVSNAVPQLGQSSESFSKPSTRQVTMEGAVSSVENLPPQLSDATRDTAISGMFPSGELPSPTASKEGSPAERGFSSTMLGGKGSMGRGVSSTKFHPLFSIDSEDESEDGNPLSTDGALQQEGRNGEANSPTLQDEVQSTTSSSAAKDLQAMQKARRATVQPTQGDLQGQEGQDDQTSESSSNPKDPELPTVQEVNGQQEESEDDEIDLSAKFAEERSVMEGTELQYRSFIEALYEGDEVERLDAYLRFSTAALSEAEHFEVFCNEVGSVVGAEIYSRGKILKYQELLWRRLVAQNDGEIREEREKRGDEVFERGWLVLSANETLERKKLLRSEEDDFFSLSRLIYSCLDYFSASELFKAQLESEWEFSLKVAVLTEKVEMFRVQSETELATVLRSVSIRDSFMGLRMMKHLPHLFSSSDFTVPTRNFYLSAFIIAKQQIIQFNLKSRFADCLSAKNCFRPQREPLPFYLARSCFSPARVDALLRREWCTLHLSQHMRRCLYESKSLETCRRGGFNLPRIRDLQKARSGGTDSQGGKNPLSTAQLHQQQQMHGGLKLEYKRLVDKRKLQKCQTSPYELRQPPRVSTTRRMLQMRKRALISHTAYVAIPYERSARLIKAVTQAFRDRKNLGASYHATLERLGAALLIQNQYRRWQLGQYKKKLHAVSGYNQQQDPMLRRFADGQTEIAKRARVKRDQLRKEEFLERYVHNSLNATEIQRFLRVQVTHRILQQRIAIPSERAYKCLVRWLRHAHGNHQTRMKRQDRRETTYARETVEEKQWMAERIQAWYRGVLCRKRELPNLEITRRRRRNLVEIEEYRYACATLVACNFRRWRALVLARKIRTRRQRDLEIDELRQKREYYATRIQSRWRVFRIRRAFLKMLRDEFKRMLQRKVEQLELTPQQVEQEIMAHIDHGHDMRVQASSSGEYFGSFESKKHTDILRVVEAARQQAGLNDKRRLSNVTSGTFHPSPPAEEQGSSGLNISGNDINDAGGNSTAESPVERPGTADPSTQEDGETLKRHGSASKLLPSVSFADSADQIPSSHQTPDQPVRRSVADQTTASSRAHATVPYFNHPSAGTLVPASRGRQALEQAQRLSTSHQALLAELGRADTADRSNTIGNRKGPARHTRPMSGNRGNRSTTASGGAIRVAKQYPRSHTAPLVAPSTSTQQRDRVYNHKQQPKSHNLPMPVLDDDLDIIDIDGAEEMVTDSPGTQRKSAFMEKHERLLGKRSPHPLLRQRAPSEAQRIRQDQWDFREQAKPSLKEGASSGGSGAFAALSLGTTSHRDASRSATNEPAQNRRSPSLEEEFESSPHRTHRGELLHNLQDEGATQRSEVREHTSQVHGRYSRLKGRPETVEVVSPGGQKRAVSPSSFGPAEAELRSGVEELLDSRKSLHYYHPIKHEATTELVKPRKTLRNHVSPSAQ